MYAIRSYYGFEIETTLKEEGHVSFYDLFTKRFRHPLILAVLICVLSEACGVSVVFYYGPKIFEAAGMGLSGSLGGFSIIAIVNFIATCFALFFVDSAGRRKLLAVGASGSFVSMLLIGMLFARNIQGWPIVAAINLFVAFFACALGPVKFVVVSEIFPTRVRVITSYSIHYTKLYELFHFKKRDTIQISWAVIFNSSDIPAINSRIIINNIFYITSSFFIFPVDTIS